VCNTTTKLREPENGPYASAGDSFLQGKYISETYLLKVDKSTSVFESQATTMLMRTFQLHRI
jgi:hypothetical protein